MPRLRNSLPFAIAFVCIGCGAGPQQTSASAPHSARTEPCVSLDVRLTCADPSAGSQCTVAVNNPTGDTILVHSSFAVGTRYEDSKWRNLYFDVSHMAGFNRRITALEVRLEPNVELGQSLIALAPNESKSAHYDLSDRLYKATRFGNALPVVYARDEIKAYYDVSQIEPSGDRPFCQTVFESNRVWL